MTKTLSSPKLCSTLFSHSRDPVIGRATRSAADRSACDAARLHGRLLAMPVPQVPRHRCVTGATHLRQSRPIGLTGFVPSTFDDVRAFKRVASMRCIACGTTMRLEQVVPAKVMRAQGYEYRSFKCSSCPYIERRLAFTPQNTSSSDGPATIRTVPKSVGTPSKDTLARLRAWARAMGTPRSRQERRS
jgi:hypothetical protein